MNIQKAAEASGLTVDTIRFYERHRRLRRDAGTSRRDVTSEAL